jgi:hypothetical protein
MWHKARAQPRQSGAGQPGVGAFSNFALPTCQGRSVHEVSNVQSRCDHKTWQPNHPSWLAELTSGPPELHFRPKHRLNPL